MCSKYVPSLSEHMNTVHSCKGMKCMVCQKRFVSWALYQQHMPQHLKPASSTVVSEGEEFPCDRWVCDHISDTEADRTAHLVRQHVCDLHKPLMKCDVCSEIFLLKYSRELHFQEYPDHCPEGRGKGLLRKLLQCDLCQESYRFESSLEEHLSWHADKRGLVCELCGYVLRSLELLQEHLIDAHKFKKESQKPACEECKLGQCVHTVAAELAKLVCDFCGEVFSSKQFMDFHIRWHVGLPNESRRYQCDICDRVLVSKSNLESHRESHYRDKQFSCHICGYVTKNPIGAKKHKALHEGQHEDHKIFWCRLCGRHYQSESALKFHIRSAHDTEPREPQLFECPECKRNLPSKAKLRSHMCTHTGKYPKHCKVCRKGFASKVLLRNHLWDEHKIGSFQCTMCNETFGQIKMRTLHYENVHRGFKSHEEAALQLLQKRAGRQYTKVKK